VRIAAAEENGTQRRAFPTAGRGVYTGQMVIGPVFTREVVTAPRRVRFYVAPAVYVGGLLILTCTAWLLLTGSQQVRNVGDMARFGGALFQFLAPLQLVLAIFFSALAAASAVAQEKDRRTLVLLLLTNLSNSELVLGKLLASLLNVLVLLAGALPFFMLTALFGGVSFEQIGRVFLVTLVSTLAAGSLGSTVALWREKTFQTLALVTLALGVLAVWQIAVAAGLFQTIGSGAVTRWAAGLSPWAALVAAEKPSIAWREGWFSSTYYMYLAAAGSFAVAVNLVAIARVRVWNPSREARPRAEEDEFRTVGAAPRGYPRAQSTGHEAHSVHAARGKARRVWDNPVLWREVCTWAYGRKIIAVRLVYLVLVAAAVMGIHQELTVERGEAGSLALGMVLLFVLSLVMVNALAVTSITTERDLGSLDLLLVTDLEPAEFIFGKLWGIFYVAKEMVALPLAVCVYLWWQGAVTLENLIYLAAGLVVMNLFVATLGLHVGLVYTNSRTAVAVSLGTVFFLFVGIAACMRIMVSFSGAFQLQLAPFLALLFGGSTGLFVALGARNPSQAIALASLLLPFATFVAITSYLQGETLGVFTVVAFTYGLTTTAMLVPAVAEFDVATGRTTE
jgi:ABC-type transport system involved in multi-copper enzyme maturation permease subunit